MTASKQYIPALDGLRAVSIILVVLSHAGLGKLVPGGLGVTIFFFISGFIITRLLLAEQDSAGAISISGFYKRRALRIFPALFVYLLISLAVFQAAGGQHSLMEIGSVFLFYVNYWTIFASFPIEPFYSPLLILWSLSVEEHYYFFYPLFFLLAAKRVRFFVTVLALVLILSLGWRLYLVFQVGLEDLAHYRIYKATDTRLDSIAFGALFAYLNQVRPKVMAHVSNGWMFLFGGMLVLATLLLRDEGFRETLRYTLQGVGLFLMFGYMILKTNSVVRFLSTKPMLYIGKISYSLYLYHWLAFGVVSYLFAQHGEALRSVLLVVLSVAAAHVSYRWVEMPFLKLRHRGTQPAAPVTAAGVVNS